MIKKCLIKNIIRTSLCLILFAMVSVTYAWFTNMWNSGDNRLPFKTGKIEYPEMTMWTYLMKEEGSSDNNGEWVENTITQDKNSAIKLIPSINKNETDGVYEYDLKELQLGTVDNVLTLKKDNEMYLRIKVDTIRFKKDFEIDVQSLNLFNVNDISYSFELYNGNSGDGNYSLIDENSSYTIQTQEGEATVTGPEIYENTNEVIETNGSMLKYMYFVSDELLTPDELDIDSFTDLENGHAEYEYDGEEDYYYVYLLITPNLNLFIDLSKILISYMPCVVLNNIKISLAFKNTNNN